MIYKYIHWSWYYWINDNSQTCDKKNSLNSIILLLPNVQMLNIVLKQVEEA
jgi:hypothetical protein